MGWGCRRPFAQSGGGDLGFLYLLMPTQINTTGVEMKPPVTKASARVRLALMNLQTCAVDGVFEELVGEGVAAVDEQTRAQDRSPGVIFHPSTGVDVAAVVQVLATVRCPLMRAFFGRCLLAGFEAKEFLA